MDKKRHKCLKKKGTEVKNKRAKKIKDKPGRISPAGRGQERRRGAGGRGLVWRALRVQRRQRGGKHQHFGLHEGQIGQGADDFRRLFAQVLVFPGLPGKRAASAVNAGHKSAKTEQQIQSSVLKRGSFLAGRAGLWCRSALTWWRCWSSPWWT